MNRIASRGLATLAVTLALLGLRPPISSVLALSRRLGLVLAMTLVVSTSSSVALSPIRTSIALGAESDLARSRPVTLYSPAVLGTAQSAVDGDDSTFVQFGSDGDSGGWAYVDIGVGVNVSSVRVLFDSRVPGCPGLGPVIESGLSPDAFTTRWTSPNDVVVDTGPVTVPVESAGDRLWRVRYTLPAGSLGFPGCRLFLASFSVFGHYTPPVPPSGAGPDLALNRPVTLYSPAVLGTAQSAVDGDDSTFVQFGADGDTNGSAYIDIGVGVSVSSVRVLFDGRVPADCPGLGPVIQSGKSADAFTTRWTSSATIVVDTGLVTVPVESAGDRFWRVRYTLPAGSLGFPGCRLFLASFSVFVGPITQPAGNAPPTGNAGGPYSVREGGSTTLSGSGSDPDGDPLSYSWDLDGDGTFETPGQTVTYSAAGRDGPSSYPVALRVCDNKGNCATPTATVNVTNASPAVASGGNVTFTEDDLEGDDDDDEGLLFTRAGSFTDPGADTWTATVDWGDGCGPQPLTLTGKTFLLSRRFSEDDDDKCRNGDDDDEDKEDEDRHKHDKHKHDKHKHDKHKHDKHKHDKDVRVLTVTVAVRDDDGGVGTATFTVTLIDD